MSRIGLFVVISLLAFRGYAQFSYTLDQSIPVEVNGNPLALPWAGGLNSVQVNMMDLNGDNQEDLVLFDRTSNKLLTYLWQSGQYQYAPDYEDLFPEQITQWILLRDFNCDGKKDLFTSDPFGITVFVNITPAGQPLRWRPYNPGFPLLTKGFSGNVNLKVNESDIPAIDDVDGDGDLDILNVRFVGIGTLEYHKNLSLERTGTCDSLQLERVTQNFGNFEECECGKFAFGQTCASLPGGRTQHAGGKALLTYDMDNDGDREVLFSEETCTRVFLLPNVGDSENALMTEATLVPATNPINFMIFPAPFIEDVDKDGKVDLLASPNVYARTYASIRFNESLWFYKNNGTNTQPQFEFRKTNFLQDEMIDVGDYSSPAFADADGDGDLDMFISYYAESDFSSSIFFYENTGSFNEPRFTYITNDYLFFSFVGFYNVKIQFADFNNDNTLDLVFTGTNPQNGVSALYYVPNKSIHRLDFSGQSILSPDFQIGQSENALVVDVDQDGINDILLGKANGALQYWRNVGPKEGFNFSMITNSFLGLDANIDRQNLALSSADLDGDGLSDLIVANQRGELTVYDNFRNQSSPSPLKSIIYNSLTEKYGTKNLGGQVLPTPANLFNADKPVIVVGNTQGGVHLLKNESGNPLPDEPRIDIYPNPVSRDEEISIRADRNMLVQFYTLVGQKISEPIQITANEPHPIRFSGLSAGIYLAHFSFNGKTIGKRIVIY